MTISSHVQKLRCQWLLNHLNRIDPASLNSRETVSWIAKKKFLFGITLPTNFSVQEVPKRKKGEPEPGPAEEYFDSLSPAAADDDESPKGVLRERRLGRFAKVKAALETALKSVAELDLPKGPVEQNLYRLCERLQFSPQEQEILLFYLDFATNDLDDLFFLIRNPRHGDDYYDVTGRFLGLTGDALKQQLAPAAPLRNFIAYDNTGNNWREKDALNWTRSDAFAADKTFRSVMQEPLVSADQVIARLIGPSPTTSLAMANFAFLGDRLTSFVESLDGMLNNNGEHRKNACLYGRPGVGKTELAAVIGARLNVPVYLVGLSNAGMTAALTDNFKEPTREERIQAWRRAAFILQAIGEKCLLVFDEADDILRNPKDEDAGAMGSKAFLNYCLDNNRTPTIFISNNIENFEESSVRRILPARYIPEPPLGVKIQILLDYAGKYKLQIPANAAEDLIKRFPGMTSGVIESCLYCVGRQKNIKDDPQQHVRALEIEMLEAQSALEGGLVYEPPKPEVIDDYTPGLLVAQGNLPLIAHSFHKSAAGKGLNVCMIGNPGAGKIAFLSYLAELRGLTPLVIPFQDFYTKMGFATRSLAECFRQAHESRAMPIFRDISPIINEESEQGKGRPQATHPLFMQMAQYKGPMAATLDIKGDNNDEEKLWLLARHFTFSARLLPLDQSRSEQALQKVTGLSASIARQVAAQLTADTYVMHDFVMIGKKIKLLPELGENADFIVELFKSLKAAVAPPTTSIGFHTHTHDQVGYLPAGADQPWPKRD